MDAPLPLLTEWFQKGDAMRQMDLLDQGRHCGMLDFDKATVNLREMKIAAGFLAPADPEFACYLKDYKTRKDKHAPEADVVIPLGNVQWSIRKALTLELRNHCKEAITRRRGIHA